MKNSIKMLAAALLSSAVVFSAALTVSAAEDVSTGTAIKKAVLLGEKPAEGCDVNKDESVNVLDLMRTKYRILNPVTEPETESGKFVYRVYRNVLGSEPDKTEAEEYTAKLENKEITAAALVQEFMQRPEYTSKYLPDADYITMLYSTFLGREPDETGYGNWIEKINYFSRDYIMRGFVVSSEFKNICTEGGMDSGDITLTELRDKDYEITRSVGQMYKRLTKKAPSAEKLNSVTQDIIDSKLTMQQAAFDLAESEELAAVTLDGDDFVKALFSALADREPSEDELRDLSGSFSSERRAELVRKVAASEAFYGVYASRGLEKHLKRIGSNYKKDGVWMHLEPSGKTYPVENETLKKLLDSCENILSPGGSGVDQIYSFCINDSCYKYMEKTKTLEEIEDKGWTYFADYAMHNYYSVCYYMAAEMDILLEQAGYQCRVVHATHGSGDHYWNQIFINGTWTNYDVTNRWKNYTWEQMVEAGDYILLGYVRPEYK